MSFRISTATLMICAAASGHAAADPLQIGIDRNGNLGMGTNDPHAPLHINRPAPRILLSDSGRRLSPENPAISILGAAEGKILFQTTADFRNYVSEVAMTRDGSLGLGDISPEYKLDVAGTAFAAGAAGALSDRRHKKDVIDLPVSALDLVLQLRPVQYSWKQPLDAGMQGEQFGFIAQEVEEILPEVVMTAQDAQRTKGLRYGAFIPVLTKSMQELKAEKDDEISALRAELGKLAQRVEFLTRENARLASEHRDLLQRVAARPAPTETAARHR